MSARHAVIQIQDVYSIPDRGEVIVGTLIEGMLFVGMNTNIAGKKSEVITIETRNRESPHIIELGGSAGILLSNIKKGDVSPGQVLTFT